MSITEIAESMDDLAARAADRAKADRLEIASLYTRLARANEQVARTIELVLSAPGNLDRPTIDKLTADLHGATVAAENYDARSKEVKADAIAKSITSAQTRTTETGNKKINAAIAAIEVVIDKQELTLPDSSDGKYHFHELTTGIRFWLEISGSSPNCIWQTPDNVPYRSGNLNEVCSDGTAIYGCSCSAQPETFWKSTDGLGWEQIDGDTYRSIERDRPVNAEANLVIPMPDFNFVPPQRPVAADPNLKRKPEVQHFLAPHPIECEYGTVDLDNEGDVVWTDRDGKSVNNGTAVEIFAIDGWLFGCDRKLVCYSTPGNKPNWKQIDRDTTYLNARSIAEVIVGISADASPIVL